MANVDGEAGSPVTRGNVAGILNAFESPATLPDPPLTSPIHSSDARRENPVMAIRVVG